MPEIYKELVRPAEPIPVQPEPAPARRGFSIAKLNLNILFVILAPLSLSLLFHFTKGNSAWMEYWIRSCMAPVMQTVGKFWSIFPFSVAEVFTALFLILSAVWLLRAVILLIRQKRFRPFLRRLTAFGCVLLWLWTLFCWTWNCTYYAPGFAQRNGFSQAPYTPEQLLTTTLVFAAHTASLSTQVPRDEDMHFSLTLSECFERGLRVYDNISETYPDLALSDRQAKPIVFSRLQSILGYTGVYFPFTGEANVNVDQVTTLVPFTIAHEMAHQRMVAAEQECNFLGVMACISSDDVVFQYSGYLMGLIYLINALHAISPDLANEVMLQSFTEELRLDWQENYDYWDALSSPAQEKAEQVMDDIYDAHLKSHGQTLGLMSYSACVDLLVNLFCPSR